LAREAGASKAGSIFSIADERKKTEKGFKNKTQNFESFCQLGR
jgi:hypothetical protein